MARHALRFLVALGALLAPAALAACSAPGTAPRPEPARPDGVVVASFDFAESELLGEVYAQALEAAGVPVRRELSLGPRELVLPALRQGLVDVAPEYLGTALTAAIPTGTPVAEDLTDTARAHQRLQDALAPDRLRALRPAAAQNQNGMAVTRATADRLGLRTISDLEPHAPDLAFTGPVECPQRPYCLPGLNRVYGLSFLRFVPYAGEGQRVTALEQRVVDVGLVFTTDGFLAAGDLVLLADDRGLQPVENVVPVVTEAAVDLHGERLVDALDAVSAQLDSAGLTFLNWRVEVAGQRADAEARAWLLRHDLVPR